MGADEDKNGQSSSSGKGKARGRDDQGENGSSQGAGSLMTSIMQSARSSVTPSNLSSLAASNGKAASSLPSSNHLSAQMQEVRQDASSSNTPTFSHSRLLSKPAAQTAAGSFRESGEDAYRQFTQSRPAVSPTLQTSPRALIGPYTSVEPLEHALHEHVREEASQWNNMNDAWGSSTQTRDVVEQDLSSPSLDPAYNSAWTCSYGDSSFNPSIMPDWRRGEQLDQMMQAVNLSGNALPTGPQQLLPPDDFMNTLGQEEEDDKIAYSSINERTQMSEEQEDLHRNLHTLQNSEERASEKVRPPDDDPVARTGVYAATPSEALRAIWDGPTEGERASATVRDRLDDTEGRSIARKIREILQRGSYVDDVYGIPPQLIKEIVTAEEEVSEENKDRRAKAIERLGALYRHLGAAPADHQSFSVDDFVRNW